MDNQSTSGDYIFNGTYYFGNTNDTGKKSDSGKPPMSLLPWAALSEVAKVLDFGRKKYSAHNWRNGFAWSRLADADLRHITSWIDGEDIDPETKLSHLAHHVCEALFLLEHTLKGYGTDDRFKSK